MDHLNGVAIFNAGQFPGLEFLLGVDVVFVKDSQKLFIQHYFGLDVLNCRLTSKQLLQGVLAVIESDFVLQVVLHILFLERLYLKAQTLRRFKHVLLNRYFVSL